MAKATFTADDIVSNLGSDKTPSALKKQIDQEYKIRLNALRKYNGDVEKANIATEKKLRKLNKESFEERKRRLKEESEAAIGFQQNLVAKSKEALNHTLGNLTKTVFNGLTTGLNNSIEQYIGAYSQYMSEINTRLQGTTKNFDTIGNLISRNVGASRFIKQEDVYKNLSKLVDEGIAYNVEQRAFLETVSDKIATTFDAANGTLLQLIRIQQADSTAARLGLEAELTQFFNRNFGDTSYLNQLFDTVSASILGANTQLGRDKSVAFEYNVQKWLGSLSSVGVSDTTIQQLAQGINYLGTGDITSLSSNTQLQNLLIMASQRGGLSFSDILSQGLTAETVNVLLENVIAFGQEIAQTSNQVVKSQYAQLFGLTVSDMTALLNLTSADLKTISKNLLDYQGAIAETESQLGKLSSRTAIKDQVENVFSNIMTTVGEGLASNASAYTSWLLTDLVEKATGGIMDIDLTPFGVGISTNVTQLIKTGIVGVSTLANLGTMLASLSKVGSSPSLSGWEASETVRDIRGVGFTGIRTTGVSSTTSQTVYIGSSSESDIYQGSLMQAQSSEEEFTRTVGQEETNQQLTDAIDKSTKIDEIVNILEYWNTNGLKVNLDETTSLLDTLKSNIGLGG